MNRGSDYYYHQWVGLAWSQVFKTTMPIWQIHVDWGDRMSIGMWRCKDVKPIQSRLPCRRSAYECHSVQLNSNFHNREASSDDKNLTWIILGHLLWRRLLPKKYVLEKGEYRQFATWFWSCLLCDGYCRTCTLNVRIREAEIDAHWLARSGLA